jgi:hypothetical protein
MVGDTDCDRFAWSGKKEIHYIVPTLSGALFGFSYVLNMVYLHPFLLSIDTTNEVLALPSNLQERRLYNALRRLRPGRLNIHALHSLRLLSALHLTDDRSTRVCLGNKPVGLHHCWADAYSVGVLEMGTEDEEGDMVFEAFRGG